MITTCVERQQNSVCDRGQRNIDKPAKHHEQPERNSDEHFGKLTPIYSDNFWSASNPINIYTRTRIRPAEAFIAL